MSGLCSTQAIKNAKLIRSVAPHVFPAVEPLDGFASVVPLDALTRFHRMSDEELRQYPQLLEAATLLRRKSQISSPKAGRLTRLVSRLLGAAPMGQARPRASNQHVERVGGLHLDSP